MTPREQQNALESQIKGRECKNCHSPPRVVWLGKFGQGEYGLRCNCWPDAPRLWKEEHAVERRQREMTNQAIKRRGEESLQYRGAGGEDISLSVSFVKELFCPTASDAEALAFAYYCYSHKLNPHRKEVFAIKYAQNQPMQIVTAVQAYISRVQHHPEYQGMENGIIVLKDGEEAYLKGARVPRGAELLGGWFRTHRKGRAVECYVELDVQEYMQYVGSGNERRPREKWATQAATMINTRAIGRGLRHEFSDVLDDLPENIEEPVELDEIDISRVDPETGEVSEQPEAARDNVIEHIPADAASEAPAETPTSEGRDWKAKPPTDPPEFQEWASEVHGIDEKTLLLILDIQGINQMPGIALAAKKVAAYAAKRKE